MASTMQGLQKQGQVENVAPVSTISTPSMQPMGIQHVQYQGKKTDKLL